MTDFRKEYEKAFLEANGYPCQLIAQGGGWYRVFHRLTLDPDDAVPYRRSQIEAMTESLKQRVRFNLT